MHLAWSTDGEILKRAEYGGAVTSLLKFALEYKWVDAVLAVKARNGKRYGCTPVLITNPEKVIETSGSLHCASPNIARYIKEYLDGALYLKIAVTCKPCDAMAIIELAKRNQIKLDNLLLIGINCTGTLIPNRTKRMIKEEFGVDPDDVVREDIEEDKLTITLKDGTEKVKNLDELEKKGYGRRENCRRCEVNIPTMADISCGKWGVMDEKETFIEVFSDKGSDLIEESIKAGYIKVKQPDNIALKTRKRKKEDAIKRAKKWQRRDFTTLKKITLNERLNYWFGQFNQCIKCFGCIDVCPICYCEDCYLEADRDLVTGGEVPPDVLFPMIRIAHVMDSCVNCGQCQDVCPMEIPLSQLTFMLNRELAKIFKYKPGVDVNAIPPLRAPGTEEELRTVVLNSLAR